MDANTIITRAQRLAGRVDPGFDERSLEFIDEAVERWCLKLPWPTLRQTFEMVTDGTRNLVAPDHIRTVRWLTDKTNTRTLEAKDNWDRERTGSYLNDTTGPAYWWREEGIDPVFRQPGSLGTLTVRSTASDTYTAHITGISRDTTLSGTAGYEFFREETVNVSGSGPATTVYPYIRVLSAGRTKRATSDMLISSGSTNLGRIGAGRFTAEYRRIELQTIPAAGTIIRAGGLTAPGQITSASHVPHPSISREFLVWYTAGLIHKAMGQFEQGELCRGRALEYLNDRVNQEERAGDRDWGAVPDQAYWDHEATRSWP